MIENFIIWYFNTDYSWLIMALVTGIPYEIWNYHRKKEKQRQKEIEQDKLAKKIAKEMLIAQEKENGNK